MDKKRHIITLKYIYVQNLKLNKLCFLDWQFKDFFIEWIIIVDAFQNIIFLNEIQNKINILLIVINEL